MLSAFKNFRVSFLIAAVLFGVIFIFVTNFSSGIITSIIDGDPQIAGAINNAPTDTEEKKDEPKVDPDLKVPEGESFTMLIVGTDYRPDMFTDYFYSESDYQAVIDKAKEDDAKKAESEKKDGGSSKSKNDDPESILTTDIRYVNATWIALVRADKENREFAVCYMSPETHIPAPFGDSTLGEVYGLYGIDTLREFVNNMTGIDIDYTFLLDGMKINDFVSSVGAVDFELKVDLYAGKEYHLSSATTVVGDEDNENEESSSESSSESTTESPTESTASSESVSSTSDPDSDPEVVENVPVLEKGNYSLSSYAVNILNTFKETSQEDVDAKSEYILSMLKQYLTRFAGWTEEELTAKMEELTVPEAGKEYDIQNPYAEKTVIATEFDYHEIETIYSMLGAIEYFDYNAFVYPGSYVDGSKTYEPDIKTALDMFKKYRSSAETQETVTEEQN